MKKQFIYIASILSAAIIFAGIAITKDDFGTKEEAQALAERAIKYINTVGVAQAVKDINNKTANLTEKDLYVYIIDNKGNIIAHGTKAYSLVGDDAHHIRDARGYYFIQDILNTKDRGWVKYWWQHQKTKDILQKETFVIRFGDGYALCSGAYIIPESYKNNKDKTHYSHSDNILED